MTAEGVDDSELALIEAPKLQRSEVHVPEAIVDRFETDVLVAEDVTDVDPAGVPADAADATDEADLEGAGIL